MFCFIKRTTNRQNFIDRIEALRNQNKKKKLDLIKKIIDKINDRFNHIGELMYRQFFDLQNDSNDLKKYCPCWGNDTCFRARVYYVLSHVYKKTMYSSKLQKLDQIDYLIN